MFDDVDSHFFFTLKFIRVVSLRQLEMPQWKINTLKTLNVNNTKNTTNKDFETLWIKKTYLDDNGDQLLN